MIQTITRNEADFSDIFYYADKKFGLSWNTCCDIFHKEEILNYENNTDFDIEEIENYYTTDIEFKNFTKFEQGYFIIHKLMEEYNFKKLRITHM